MESEETKVLRGIVTSHINWSPTLLRVTPPIMIIVEFCVIYEYFCTKSKFESFVTLKSKNNI